jgi:signal transduction histidine kinase
MRDASRVQIERDIARCRVILSIAAPFAVYLDPTEPTLFFQLTGGLFLIDPYALAVLVLHLIYSVTVYFIVSRPAVSLNRVAVLSMTADVLFGAAVALVTEGTNSPYYIFFLFAVLAAGLRGRRRTALIVTSASLAVYLALILVSRPEGLGFYVTRAVYLAITGYLVAALGRQRHILETGFHGLARSLHDGYAQALAGVNLRVETCRELLRRGQSADAFEELTELQAGVTREYDDLRAYVRSLLGLDATARAEASSTTRYLVRAQFEGSLPVIEHAMQIAMEGARNVARHARAREAVITVSPVGRRVIIRIDDDGVGFSPDDEPPWSIASRAAELGGQVRIGRDRPAGGHVVVELPTR